MAVLAYAADDPEPELCDHAFEVLSLAVKDYSSRDGELTNHHFDALIQCTAAFARSTNGGRTSELAVNLLRQFGNDLVHSESEMLNWSSALSDLILEQNLETRMLSSQVLFDLLQNKKKKWSQDVLRVAMVESIFPSIRRGLAMKSDWFDTNGLSALNKITFLFEEKILNAALLPSFVDMLLSHAERKDLKKKELFIEVFIDVLKRLLSDEDAFRKRMTRLLRLYNVKVTNFVCDYIDREVVC